MKKNSVLIITVLSLVFAVVQTSFFAYLLSVKLNANFIAALCFALLFYKRVNSSYFVAIIGGMFVDLLGTGIIGLSPLLLTSYVFLYNWLSTFYMRSHVSKALVSLTCFYTIKLLTLHLFVFDMQLVLSAALTVLIGYLFVAMFKGTAISEQKINY